MRQRQIRLALKHIDASVEWRASMRNGPFAVNEICNLCAYIIIR